MNPNKTNCIKIGLIFVLLLILVSSPVLAVDFSGNFSRTDATTSTGWVTNSDGTGATPSLINSSRFKVIEDYQSLSAFTSTDAYTGYTWDYSVQSFSTTVDAYAGTTYLGSGVFGFNNNTATGMVNIFFYPSGWNIGALTGSQWVNFTDPANPSGFAAHGLKDLKPVGAHCLITAMCVFVIPDGGWGNLPDPLPSVYIGTYTLWNQFKFENSWTLTKTGPAVEATVKKSISGTPYKSKVYLFRNDSSSGVITSDLALSFTNFDQFTNTIPLKFAVLDSKSNWYNTSYYYSVPSTNYTISVSPTDISSNASAIGEVISLTDTTFSQVTAINWQYYITSPLADLHDFYENGDNIHGLNYVLKSGNWYGWNVNDGDFTNNKGATFPKQVVLYPQSSGNLTVLFTVYNLDGNMTMMTAPLNVGAGGIKTNIILEAADWQSGMLISPVNWSVMNLYNNNWSNYSVTTGDGHWTVQYSPGITLYVEANAYGYAKGTLTKQVPSGNDIWVLPLYPLTAVSGNLTNTTLLVKVMGDNNDGKYQPLNNVAVTLSDTQSQLTATLGGVAGQAQFTVKNDTIYSVSAKKDKYISVTKTVFVTGDIYTTTLFMSPLAGSTVIPTTATTRPTATPTVTLSGYQPAYGNFTGFWAPFENMGVAMGAQPSEVGVLMMFLLIIGFLILGGWAAGPLGAEVGVVAGMVCSVAFGFLPFAISIAVIAILCLYGALRIWGVTR